MHAHSHTHTQPLSPNTNTLDHSSLSSCSTQTFVSSRFWPPINYAGSPQDNTQTHTHTHMHTHMHSHTFTHTHKHTHTHIHNLQRAEVKGTKDRQREMYVIKEKTLQSNLSCIFCRMSLKRSILRICLQRSCTLRASSWLNIASRRWPLPVSIVKSN